MGTVKQLLAIARGELGNTESPAGSNRTKYGKWMGLDGYAWCMSFVQWCFAQAGVKLPLKTGSCGELMRAAQAAGCWVTRDFLPGDVVIYDFPGGAATDHCGIVEVELPDYVDSATATSSGRAEFNRAQALDAPVARSVQAIEGNTSQSGSQSNGGMVCRKNRPAKYIVGAVRPQFEEEKEENMDKDTFKKMWLELRKDLQDNDSEEWSQQAREWAVRAGLIKGSDPLPDGSPNYMWEDLLTREQMVVLLYRFAQMAGMM